MLEITGTSHESHNMSLFNSLCRRLCLSISVRKSEKQSKLCLPGSHYSKHPHIRTLILEVRLIRFLYIGCLVKNQPEGVLKLFLKIGDGNQNCNKYTKKKPEIKLAYLM